MVSLASKMANRRSTIVTYGINNSLCTITVISQGLEPNSPESITLSLPTYKILDKLHILELVDSCMSGDNNTDKSFWEVGMSYLKLPIWYLAHRSPSVKAEHAGLSKTFEL